MTDVDVMDAGGTLWDAPNQQVVRADQSGPGVQPEPEPDPPTISGTTPAGPFTNAANVNLSIQGTLFGPGSMLFFAGFSPANYTVVSATQIDVVGLEIQGLAPGSHDLSVFDPATGASSLPFPIVITAA